MISSWFTRLPLTTVMTIKRKLFYSSRLKLLTLLFENTETRVGWSQAALPMQ